MNTCVRERKRQRHRETGSGKVIRKNYSKIILDKNTDIMWLNCP